MVASARVEVRALYVTICAAFGAPSQTDGYRWFPSYMAASQLILYLRTLDMATQRSSCDLVCPNPHSIESDTNRNQR
eukprot:1187812-Prorocentrum_minimum.AAC.3